MLRPRAQPAMANTHKKVEVLNVVLHREQAVIGKFHKNNNFPGAFYAHNK